MFILFVLLFIIDFILFEFISFFFPELVTNNELYSLLFILIHGISVLFILSVKGDQYKHIFIIAFILRLLILFADLYSWFPVLHSGADTEHFNRAALYNLTHTDKVFENSYVNFLTFLYSYVHCSRLIAQYVNLILGIGIIITLREILEMLRLNTKLVFKSLLFVAFLPNLVIFSSILMREAWIEFFVIVSIKYFLDWYLNNNTKSQVLSIICVLMAALMHSGTVVMVSGYMVAFLTYNPHDGHIELSRQSIWGLIVVAIGIVFLIGNADTFASHFDSNDPSKAINQAVKNVESIGGGSTYLTWINYDNVFLNLLFSPLKMVYFLYSPLPTNWYRISDIVAFIIDSSVYIYLTFHVWKATTDVFVKKLRGYLLIGLGLAIFVFALGTFTAGTAMRHRAKLAPVIVVLYAITTSANLKEKEETNIKE